MVAARVQSGRGFRVHGKVIERLVDTGQVVTLGQPLMRIDPAFIPLTQSVFWESLAYTLIGGTAGGTMLILVFLPTLYAIWLGVRPVLDVDPADLTGPNILPESQTS